MERTQRQIFKQLLSVIFLLLVACGRTGPITQGADAADSPLWNAHALSGVWEYRVGRSPVMADGSWLWAQSEQDDGLWRRLGHARALPMRNGERELWARVRLTGPLLADPTLALPVVGSRPEVFLAGRKLPLEALPHHVWEDYRHHERRFLVSLNSDYAGTVLTVHLQSDGPRIGILRPVCLGERAAVAIELLRNALSTLLVAVLVSLLGLGAGALFLFNRNDRSLLYFSLTCLTACLYFTGSTGVIGLLIRPAPPSNVVFTVAAPLMVLSLSMFTEKIIGQDQFKLMGLTQYSLGLGLTAEFACILVDIRLLDRLILWMNMLMIAALVVLVFSTVSKAKHGDIDGKILLGGLSMSTLIVTPGAMALSGLWSPTGGLNTIPLGFLSFISFLAAVQIRRFMAVHRQLGSYSRLLSEQVQALEKRNAEIQTLNSELRRQIELRSDRMIELLTRTRAENAPAPAKPLQVGQLLGEHYRVIRMLGHGAMGCVYEVERTTDSIRLAAKLLLAQADRSAMIRLVREARILAQLRHPNLVAISDIDLSPDGALFLVMELVVGSTLKDAKSQYGDLRFAWAVLRQISQALKAIHAQGVVHRDLKPANILLAQTPDGIVAKLADFGISMLVEEFPAGEPDRQLNRVAAPPMLLAEASGQDDDCPTLDLPPDAQSTRSPQQAAALGLSPSESPSADLSGPLTQTGMLLGTPIYMAPELATGSRNAPAASDIFSLGVIAFELLTGNLPFRVPPVLAVWQKQSLTAPELADLRPDLPGDVAMLIQRCLDPDPRRRPTPDELLAAIP